MIVERVYHSNRVTLYRGDCREAVETVERGSCGLMVTDPPYGVSYESNFRGESLGPIEGDDGRLNVPAVLGSWARALRSRRHVYVFGFRPADLDLPMRLSSSAELVWDKGTQPGMGNLELPWGASHEMITFGVYQSWAKNDGRSSGNLSARLRHGSVLSVARKNSGQTNRHPTEKPVALLVQLIESSSSRGDIVLDPFVGCGSTLVAAVLCGRRAIGVELDAKHCATAIDRLKDAERIADMMEAA